MPKVQDRLLMPGKVAVVCGASQGIGQSAAEALADLGCRVILVARNTAKLEKVRAHLTGEGHEVLPCDFTKPQELSNLIDELSKRSIQILVNNSGGPKGGPLLAASSEDFSQAFAQHILVAQRLAQVLVPQMREVSYGRIINVISTSVKAPIANLGVSNTIRGAMANWAKTLAGEVASLGITVNNVLPGYTETARLEQLRQSNAERAGVAEDQINEQWLSGIPAKRFGEAWELGAAIAFLASPLASYINGINLPVDGGRTPSL